MATEVLRGFADASGCARTASDKILTVNGCLSTPSRWDEFGLKWRAYLEDRGFKRDARSRQHVFHTSRFWSGKCPLMPKGLTYIEKQRIYRYLIELIREYTVGRFGLALSLTQYREFQKEFPGVDKFIGREGTYLSKICFIGNSVWAKENGYDQQISYTFDRGDEFWRNLFYEYREALRKHPDDIIIGGLASENKAYAPALQAADVVAWECRNYFLQLSEHHLRGVHTVLPEPSYELKRLNIEGEGGFLSTDVKRYTAN